MRVSINWLRELVDFDLTAEELGHRLTMAGLELEGIETLAAPPAGIEVAEMVAVRPHPDADKLNLVQVRWREGEAEIVCGAPNVAVGSLAPLALPGTVLPNGMKVEKRAVRGVESVGMLCSEAELGLSEEHAGLMILPPGTALQPLAGVYDFADTVLDLSITPNRADCLSMSGVAREVAALAGTRRRLPEIAESGAEGASIDDVVPVEVADEELCPRYTLRLIEGMQVLASPLWMQRRLVAAGVRPINNLVDVTNYVMMELGQPLHAFDKDRLEGGRIVVRRAREGEKILALDTFTYELQPHMLAICDANKPVAVAGVMGGEDTGVIEGTQTVALESAVFNPSSVRRTARELNLHSESSYRFERGIDPTMTPLAATRAAHLLAEVGGGKVVPGIIDTLQTEIPPRRIQVSVPRCNALLRLSLSDEEMARELRKIEIEAEPFGEIIECGVPPCRVDIERPVDLMEEVAPGGIREHRNHGADGSARAHTG